MGGTTDTEFSPDHSLTREQVCTILTRFAALEGISLIQAVEPEQFKDSLEISDYAYVMETGNITMAGPGKALMNDERVKAAYLGE